MKTAPIVAAHIVVGDDGVPRAPDFGDVYHPRVGALEQARHVFLAGNGLPQRWAGRERFVVLETGFGLGNNFLAFRGAWQQDPQRCRQLVFVSIEKHPPTREDLARAHAGSPLPALARELIAAWPPLTPNLHLLDFDGGQVRLLLALGEVRTLLGELALQADAFCLDGFAPARNPAMWDERLLRALGRHAAPGASAATWSVARAVQDGLRAGGFEVQERPGIGGKREISVAHLRPQARRAVATPARRRDAVVVGAGLAGAAVARALADEGWAVTVLDRRSAPAQETSGNPGGLFHGTLHADDGPHARLLRAAALHLQRVVAPLIAGGTLPGQLQGLLRLETRPLPAMQALLEAQRLPPGWVQALDQAAAEARAGVPLPANAWCFSGGGWLAPAALVQHWLQGLPFVGDAAVHALRSTADGWQLLADDGRPLHEAGAVVLANAGDAARLLGADWPLQRLRGQVSGWQGGGVPLRLPVAGGGYALPLPGGGLLCGASQQEDDDDGALRDADTQENLAKLQRLTGLQPPPGAALFGRVGWRIAAEDRLPIAGPVPAATPGPRRDQARLWPRVPGLFVCTALGGRGITLAPLLGRLLAAQVAGAPLPLEQDLVDAVDPARWWVRAARRAGAQG